MTSSTSTETAEPVELPIHCTTIEAAKRLGLAVRSIQMMVDRGELQGWKTAGGHRRIALASIERWISERRLQAATPTAIPPAEARSKPAPALSTGAPPSRPDLHLGLRAGARASSVLIIEDSIHYQKLLTLLLAQQFPTVELHIADDGLSGLAMCGAIRPDVLIVDILLPGIDGATLITSLRSSEHFTCSQLIVVTSLDDAQREPFAFALQGVPVIHKTRLVTDLPALLERSLQRQQQAAA